MAELHSVQCVARPALLQGDVVPVTLYSWHQEECYLSLELWFQYGKDRQRAADSLVELHSVQHISGAAYFQEDVVH